MSDVGDFDLMDDGVVVGLPGDPDALPLPRPPRPPRRGRGLWGRAADVMSASKTVVDRPDICVTVASEFPDRLRLVKRVHLFPLTLSLRADYVRRTREFEYGCSAQDAILGGDVRLDASTRTLQYHKRVPLGATGGHVGVFAGASLAGALRGDLSRASLRPHLAFRYELGGGGAVLNGDRIDVRHRFRVANGLAVEARGAVKLPTARAEVAFGDADTRLSLGDGAPLHLHLEEVNLVFIV